jgi:hypothetical protein
MLSRRGSSSWAPAVVKAASALSSSPNPNLSSATSHSMSSRRCSGEWLSRTVPLKGSAKSSPRHSKRRSVDKEITASPSRVSTSNRRPGTRYSHSTSFLQRSRTGATPHGLRAGALADGRRRDSASDRGHRIDSRRPARELHIDKGQSCETLELNFRVRLTQGGIPEACFERLLFGRWFIGQIRGYVIKSVKSSPLSLLISSSY